MTTPTTPSGLPELPTPFAYLCDWGRDDLGLDHQTVYYDEPGSAIEDDWNVHPKVHLNLPLHTADQLRTYGQQCADQALAARESEAEPELCPYCDGSGESSYMSDGGPDAYDVPCDCPHCNGDQTLVAAYDGVRKLLEREEKKYREVAAIMFHGSHGTVAGRLADIAQYVMKPDMSAEWVRDRLLALADMAKTAPPKAGAEGEQA